MRIFLPRVRMGVFAGIVGIVSGCSGMDLSAGNREVIAVESDPPGLRIEVDHDYVGDTPMMVTVDRHTGEMGLGSRTLRIKVVSKELSSCFEEKTIWLLKPTPARLFFNLSCAPKTVPPPREMEAFKEPVVRQKRELPPAILFPQGDVSPDTIRGTPSSDVDVPQYSNKENKDNFAVVIGIEKYSSDLPKAEYSERDAHAMKDHLVALGYPLRNIAFLTGPNASVGSIKKILETWLPNNVNSGSTVIFYFSGHGSPDIESGDAYLVPWDGDPQYLKDTGYPLRRVYEKLGELNGKMVVVILDSCFSGQSGRSILPGGAKPLVGKVNLGVKIKGGMISLSASGENEISGTIPEQGHGLFTYYFLKGLNGGAVKKGTGVTLETLFEYLRPRVQDAANRANRRQTPQLIRTNSADDQKFRIR